MASEFVLYGRDHHAIGSWGAWTRPAHSTQWELEAGAQALARACFRTKTAQVPAEIQSLVDTHPLTTGLEFTEGWPEVVTPLPLFEVGTGRSRGHRTDLVLYGEHKGKKAIACVDARIKGLGSGPTLREVAQQAKNPNATKEGKDELLRSLMSLLFPSFAVPDKQPWSELDYGFVTGAASTALQAAHDGASIALFIVFEFGLQASALQGSWMEKDMASPIQALCGVSRVEVGQLYGPLRVYHSDFVPDGVSLLMGKVNCYR